MNCKHLFNEMYPNGKKLKCITKTTISCTYNSQVSNYKMKLNIEWSELVTAEHQSQKRNDNSVPKRASCEPPL